MKVAVIGGTGHISGSLVARLLQLGYEVTCCNRGKSGPAPDDARQLSIDRQDREAFETAMRREKFDAVIDMICFTREDAESAMRACPEVGQYVQISTVCTYGIRLARLPAAEDHPLHPVTPYGRHKVEADEAYLQAWRTSGFPVTVVKPSTTYGPKIGLLRQVAWEFSWIDRVRKGKPIVVCGDGNALHQFLHVDDAAVGIAGVLGKAHCLGETYNLVDRGFTTWADYHRTAMAAIGNECELVGIPLAELLAEDPRRFGICGDIFAHHAYYNAEKLFRDVPEFRPKIGLREGMGRVLEQMDREGRIPESDAETWEYDLVRKHRR